jgi:hypothetical protein
LKHIYEKYININRLLTYTRLRRKMSSSQISTSTSTRTNTNTNTKPTRGTFMAVNGKRVYVETRSLDDCLINVHSDELSEQLRDKLQSVFSLSTSTDHIMTCNNNKIYIPFVFDYDYENPNNIEEYKISGFWNPNTKQYEFDNNQLVNLISKM